jgi:hypothetical protein
MARLYMTGFSFDNQQAADPDKWIWTNPANPGEESSEATNTVALPSATITGPLQGGVMNAFFCSVTVARKQIITTFAHL